MEKYKPKIYDCFTFFNELDLLELRLRELYNYVDFFVIVEATSTHSGAKKPLYFKENIGRYEKWKDKIRYVETDLPKFNLIDKAIIKLDKITKGKITRTISSNFGLGRWKPENAQRKAIIKGLYDCKDFDIIMVSDLDEIPNPKKFLEMKKLLKKYKKIGFEQDLFFYFLNLKANTNWIGTKACYYKTLISDLKGNTQRVRLRFLHYILDRIGLKEDIRLIKKGGWHFSYIGGPERIIEKINSIAEGTQFVGELNSSWIDQKIKSGICFSHKNIKLSKIKINDSLPKSVRDKKFSNLIKP